MEQGKKPDAHAGIHPHPGHQRLSERRVPSRPARQTPARQSQSHPIQHRGGASVETPFGRTLPFLPGCSSQGAHPRYHAV